MLQPFEESSYVDQPLLTAEQPLPRPGSALPTILGIAAILFALDQATKFLVVQNIPLYASWSFFPNLARLFKFTFITNTGAAFGMFPQLGGVFMVVAIVVITAIVIFYHHLPAANLWVRVSLGMQLGGALGNLVDRITRGYVVDFVDIGFWPIFNLADLSIVLGVSILAYYLWNEENSSDQPASRSNLSQGGNR
ncbi:MAG: signal peptidase II [Anaerolineae bacterium]